MTDTNDMTDEELAQGIRDTIGSFKCCATCKHWDHLSDAMGHCLIQRYLPDGHDVHWQFLTTTDLAVCSKWEQKDDE